MYVDEGPKSTVIWYSWPLLEHHRIVLLNTVQNNEQIHRVDRLIAVELAKCLNNACRLND